FLVKAAARPARVIPGDRAANDRDGGSARAVEDAAAVPGGTVAADPGRGDYRPLIVEEQGTARPGLVSAERGTTYRCPIAPFPVGTARTGSGVPQERAIGDLIPDGGKDIHCAAVPGGCVVDERGAGHVHDRGGGVVDGAAVGGGVAAEHAARHDQRG